MVCVPCFIIPVLLYIWHKFVQPLLLRYWNPWQKKDTEGNVIQEAPKFPFECKSGVCLYSGAKKTIEDNGLIANPEDKATEVENETTSTLTEAANKKVN